MDIQTSLPRYAVGRIVPTDDLDHRIAVFMANTCGEGHAKFTIAVLMTIARVNTGMTKTAVFFVSACHNPHHWK